MFEQFAVASPFQPGSRRIRVLLPQRHVRPHHIVYVLPVEAEGQHLFGDPCIELERIGAADAFGIVFAIPDFAQTPWFGDHPSRAEVRQESHFVQIVCPAVERELGWSEGARIARLLLGFSKSGWGAWSLLLRHPDYFARAFAWDAPFMLDRIGPWDTLEVFGTQDQFERFQPARLVQTAQDALGTTRRLHLQGPGIFDDHIERMHALLTSLGIAHDYQRGARYEHRWHSGWLETALPRLLDPNGS